jgi:hypothetical protein
VQDFRKRRRLWLFWLPAGLAGGAASAAVARAVARQRRTSVR